MLNFLDPNLVPKIKCKTPSTDNYEIENLISDKYTEKVRGFIAYPAIKPPVEVEIEFICPINMHYIVLNTTVGNQKCSGIELFAKTNSMNYSSIGKSIYDKPGIIFCNSRMYSKDNLPSSFNKEYELNYFKSNMFKFFLNATSIKVLIFRTIKSVPCLSSVEVWGTPSKSCSQKTIDTINKLANKANPISVPETTVNVEFKIPDDFKDALTYELMTLPVTLPSGKTIDQSTLDKHIESEKSFGRKPCDPFTGIKFSQTLKPLVNTPLKSRIDMFVMQNSHREEFRNIKRTLGGNPVTYAATAASSSQKRILENVNDDLENAILRAKKSKDFVSFTNDEMDQKKCKACKNEFIYLYKLPCDHFYCRSCLLKICVELKCSFCYQDFQKNDINKINF